MSPKKKSNRVDYIDPSEEMKKRWLRAIQKCVPTIDFEDIVYEKQFPYNQAKRQFAPEYSQSAYLHILS